jgi:pSer/pThr/pTyr-binding forkhead associated (FHA) protein
VAGKRDSSDSPMALHAEGLAKPLLSGIGKREEVVIGRGIECDVVIKDAKASRKHCKLVRKDDGFLLEDLGSKNGTFVDGKRISEKISVKPQQTFKIGDTIFYLSS